MKKALRDRWVQELRSGRHTKITGNLDYGPNLYCALGVLANICSGYVCGLVLAHFAPANLEPVVLSKITLLNDYHRLSFPEIADWIEQHITAEEECPVRRHHHHSERSHA